jgi:hypothetical protein
MKTSPISALVLSLSLISPFAFANNKSDSESALIQEAIKDTEAKMSNPQEREKLIQQDASSKKAHQQVLEFTGGDKKQTDDLYSAAASILGTQKFKNQEEMLAWMQKAQKNPKEFYEGLSPEQKKKISEIADQIEESKKKKP